MYFKILDSIPVVGHVKGVFHYVTGDLKGAKRAMCEATRSAAVMAGGAIGVVGGPAGMAAGAVAAGMVADLLTTTATGTPEGVIAGVTGIVTDIANGDLPIESVLNLTLCLAGDVVGGIGGGSVANSAAKAVSEAVGKNVGKEVTKTITSTEAAVVVRTAIIHSFARTSIETANIPHGDSRQRTQNKSNKSSPSKNTDSNEGKSKNGNTESSSGSDPPEENRNTTKKEHCEDTTTHWDAFLKIFDVISLDDICMGKSNTQIFKNLSDGHRKSLKKLVNNLQRHGDAYFSRTIIVVIKIFMKFDDPDVTFQNFISLVQFIQTYVGEEVAQRNEENRTAESFEVRLRMLTNEVTLEIVNDISNMWYKYKSLKYFIQYHITRIWPTFRNIVSAAYRYYKHRLVPEQTRILTVEEYFDLIQSLLAKFKTVPEFSELSNLKREVVFERYLSIFKRRLRIVVKVQGNVIELSSCYFLSVFVQGDEEGDEYLDGKKIKKESQTDKK